MTLKIIYFVVKRGSLNLIQIACFFLISLIYVNILVEEI